MTEKDKKNISRMIENNNELGAENLFLTKYIFPLTLKFKTTMSALIGKCINTQLPEDEINKIRLVISNTTVSYKRSILDLFSDFAGIYSRKIYEKYGITSPAVKRTIKNSVLEEFKYYTESALSKTNNMIVSIIRKYQTEVIKGNLKIDKMIDAGEILKKEVGSFQTKLYRQVNKMFPEMQKMQRGNFVVYSNGSMHGIQEYANMSVRTTILNVDRTAVEIKSVKDGRRVVEFYQRDKRGVTQDREVCQSIMNVKIKGISMLALDSGAADVLEIKTLAQAKEEDGHAFGPNCRHSIRPLSEAIYKEIEKLLFVAETEVA